MLISACDIQANDFNELLEVIRHVSLEAQPRDVVELTKQSIPSHLWSLRAEPRAFCTAALQRAGVFRQKSPRSRRVAALAARRRAIHI
jgi:hypothetical protein